MTRFKSRSGFTLIETLFALSFLAISIMPLFRLQTQILIGTSSLSLHMQRLLLMKNYRYQARKALQEKIQNEQTVTQFTLEKKIAYPEMVMKYTFEPIAKKSVLRGMKGLYRERVTAQWTERGLQQQDTVVMVLFNAPIEKKQKEPA